MKIWCYMVQMSVNKQTTWLNQCVQHVIQVEEVWQIREQDLGKTKVLKTNDAVAIK